MNLHEALAALAAGKRTPTRAALEAIATAEGFAAVVELPHKDKAALVAALAAAVADQDATADGTPARAVALVPAETPETMPEAVPAAIAEAELRAELRAEIEAELRAELLANGQAAEAEAVAEAELRAELLANGQAADADALQDVAAIVAGREAEAARVAAAAEAEAEAAAEAARVAEADAKAARVAELRAQLEAELRDDSKPSGAELAAKINAGADPAELGVPMLVGTPEVVDVATSHGIPTIAVLPPAVQSPTTHAAVEQQAVAGALPPAGAAGPTIALVESAPKLAPISTAPGATVTPATRAPLPPPPEAVKVPHLAGHAAVQGAPPQLVGTSADAPSHLGAARVSGLRGKVVDFLQMVRDRGGDLAAELRAAGHNGPSQAMATYSRNAAEDLTDAGA